MTKVVKKQKGSAIPAGLLSGVEAFWKNGEKYLIIKGQSMKFEDAPIRVQNAIAQHCINDHEVCSRIEAEVGATFSAVFNQWYRCRVGGLDSTPDFSEDLSRYNPDEFNNQCLDYNCSMRGKICNNLKLKHYHMPTISLLLGGATVGQIAKRVNLSPDGIKSQLKRIKEITGAKNNAHLSAIMAAKGMQVSTFNTSCHER